MEPKDCVPILPQRDVSTQIRYETLIQLIVQLNQASSLPAAAAALVSGIKYIVQVKQWRLLQIEDHAIVEISGDLRSLDLKAVDKEDISAFERTVLATGAPLLLGPAEILSRRSELPAQLAGSGVEQIYALPARLPNGTPDNVFLIGTSGASFSSLDLKFAGLVARLFSDKVKQLRTEAKLLQAEREIRERNRQLAETLHTLEERDYAIQEDLEQAQGFQRSLLTILPKSVSLQFASLYLPAEKVGGDIYDVSEISPDVFRLFLADTTGHGVQASLRTMVLKTTYDRIKLDAPDPASALYALNQSLCGNFPGLELMCTASCVDISARTGVVRYANCGQVPILLLQDRLVQELYQPGPFLGMSSEIELVSQELELPIGGRMLISTDGLYEQRNRSGEELGVGNVGRIVATAPRLADALIQLTQEVNRYAQAPSEQNDDITVLAIERTS